MKNKKSLLLLFNLIIVSSVFGINQNLIEVFEITFDKYEVKCQHINVTMLKNNIWIIWE